MRFQSSRVIFVTTVALVLLVATGVAQAREVQLAGVRLGAHAVNLLDIYGMPDGIAVGEGEAIAAAQAPGAAAGAPTMAAPGMDLMQGLVRGMQLGAAGGIMGGMMEAPMPGMPGMPAGPGEFPGAGMPGMPGGEAGGPGGGMPGGEGGGMAAGGLQSEPFPIWALPVWVDLGPREVQWVYNKGPVVLGFVLDRDGFVKAIAIAAEKCDFARTALWRPHAYVKLGDDFKRVIYRYGYPDEIVTFTSSGPGSASTGGGSVSVQFGQTTRTFSRDCILRYRDNNNIEFTLHNMKVTRLVIWQ
jgi:hypothetical protein